MRSQMRSGFIEGCEPYSRSLEREFSRGMSHQFLGGLPRESDSAVTRPTPLASASLNSASAYASVPASRLNVCAAPGLTNHSRCSMRTAYLTILFMRESPPCLYTQLMCCLNSSPNSSAHMIFRWQIHSRSGEP